MLESDILNHSFDRIRAAIAADLQIALKSRDRIAVAALRGALGALDNATAAPIAPGTPSAPEVPRHLPAASDLAAALQHEIDTRVTAAREYQRLGRTALADDFHLEADIIRQCLRHLRVRPGAVAP